MQRAGQVLIGCLLVWGSIPPSSISAKPLQVVNSVGEKIEIDIQATDSFLDVMAWIESYCQSEPVTAESATRTEMNWDWSVSPAKMSVRAKKAFRDYDVPITKEDKKNLAYIVNTLARDSLLSIGTSRSSIKKVGDKLEHLHPLRFVMIIFTDEEMKAGAHAIRDRGGWIWDGFLGGITRSLTDESARQNVKEEHIRDFAKVVGIDADLILPPLQQERWKDFVDILIDNIPRQNDPNRYNM